MRTMRTTILQSSLNAMQSRCPNGHGYSGFPCYTKNGDRFVTIVCNDRRALFPILSPHKQVKVKFTPDGVMEV